MILLDTHVLIWLRFGHSKLGRRTRRAIERAWSHGEAAVSAISFWEIGVLTEKGRVNIRVDLIAWRREMLRQGLIEIPVDGEIAARAGALQNIHGDPADRLIMATALGGHRLATADQCILDWPGALDRLRASD